VDGRVESGDARGGRGEVGWVGLDGAAEGGAFQIFALRRRYPFATTLVTRSNLYHHHTSNDNTSRLRLRPTYTASAPLPQRRHSLPLSRAPSSACNLHLHSLPYSPKHDGATSASFLSAHGWASIKDGLSCTPRRGARVALPATLLPSQRHQLEVD
jgi:hypothetical protein